MIKLIRSSSLIPFIKICCIGSVIEAEMAIKHGASALGFVGPMPSGPGMIDDALIRDIVGAINPLQESFLLTSETKAEKIISHHKKVNTTTIQLVDEVEEGAYELIRAQLPEVKLVQVIHVLDDDSINQAMTIAEHADAILLDSGNPNLAVKELGGTGRIHNWNLSRQIVESVSIPVILAGGLNADNVVDAYEAVQPYGVDLCSGVRTDYKLDEIKLKAFLDALENHFS